MGYDGSGKTTIAKHLKKFFKKLGFDVAYKHEYDYAILRVFRILAAKKYENYKERMITGQKKSGIHLIWPCLVWIDLMIQFLYLKIFKRKALVIFDRYFFDHYLSFLYLNTHTKLSKWLYAHSPLPDVSIVLLADPLTAFQRKKYDHPVQIYSLNFYKKQHKVYTYLASLLNIPTINTTIPLKHTFQEVLKQVFQNDSIRNSFITHCRINKILYFALLTFKLYEVHNEFKKYYQLYQKRKEVYYDIINYVKANQKIIIKDPPRSFPWIPEKDIDLIIFNHCLQIPRRILDKWKKYFEIDIIPFQRVKNLAKIVGITNLNRLKTYMPTKFLLGMILVNGLIRYDELLLRQRIKELQFDDKGLKLIKEYFMKLDACNVVFPHFIPITVLGKALLLSSLPKLSKIRILVFRLISGIYHKITNKILFHSPREVVFNEI